mmetsp:Transcript_48630/g.141727  ORF Transcript_48630/g.141727 Transcript_48630/m.141727 type:complete len:345 (-) Transcript_48630:687-1721(-)
MSCMSWPIGATSLLAKPSASDAKISAKLSKVKMTTSVNIIEYTAVCTSSSWWSYRKYVGLRMSMPSTSWSAKSASQGTTWISLPRRRSPRNTCCGSYLAMSSGFEYRTQLCTWACISPPTVSPVLGCCEKGTKPVANQGAISSFMSVQFPPTSSDSNTFSINLTNSPLHTDMLSGGDSTGKNSNRMRVMMTTLRVVVAPICAPIVSARVIGSPPSFLARNSSSASSLSLLRDRLLLRWSSTLMKRMMRTNRRKRSSLSNLTLRPARVPSRAARAARATGPLSLKLLPSKTKMSSAIDKVAIKSRKKNKPKLYLGVCNSDATTCINHSKAKKTAHTQSTATKTSS